MPEPPESLATGHVILMMGSLLHVENKWVVLIGPGAEGGDVSIQNGPIQTLVDGLSTKSIAMILKMSNLASIQIGLPFKAKLPRSIPIIWFGLT